MNTKFFMADPMMDQMMHRFLEIIFKIPFEPWSETGREIAIVILAYTVLLAYGKMLSAFWRGLVRSGHYLIGWRK